VVDLNYLPDIFSLTIFIVGFRPLVRKVGPHANLWFIGWGFILLRYLALCLAQPTGRLHVVTSFLAFWPQDLAGLTFLLAAGSIKGRRLAAEFVATVAIPVLAQSALFLLGNPYPALSVGAMLLFLLPGAYMALAATPRPRPLTVLSIAFGLTALGLVPLAARHPELVGEGVLCMLFLSTAYLYLVNAPRKTRGPIAAVLGLVGWALSFPVVALLNHAYPGIVLNRTLVEAPQYLVITGIILTLIEEYVLRTERLAMHDPLTDLPNRRLFEERLIATMEEARIHKTTVACLVIDVDNFKQINDTLGHSAGDQLLRALAVRLSWHMSPRDILARTGGDEFTALLAGVTDEHHLRFIAGAMMSAASVPIMVDGKAVDVRISVGIALSPDDADDIDSLRRAADEAMYSAKRRGGSALAFAGDE
jgi:diguanylate cyclase (GGDEF)-like protein